jgi:hypothetical protein
VTQVIVVPFHVPIAAKLLLLAIATNCPLPYVTLVHSLIVESPAAGKLHAVHAAPPLLENAALFPALAIATNMLDVSLSNVGFPYAISLQSVDAGSVTLVHVSPFELYEPIALPVCTTANLPLPAAMDDHEPTVGKFAVVHVLPFSDQLIVVPVAATATNLPLFPKPVYSNVTIELVLSSVVECTVIVILFSSAAPIELPKIVTTSPTANPAPPFLRVTV